MVYKEDRACYRDKMTSHCSNEEREKKYGVINGSNSE